ncbi:MAG: hypothetical protein ACI97K_001496 [Glaciecola sp.]|jgi:hypothetical protein
MRKQKYSLSIIASALLMTGMSASTVAADSFYEALSSGKASGNFNLRYEDVSQDNTLNDASAFTLRTRLGYTSADLDGWSVSFELEDNRIVLGQGDYTVGPTAYNLGQYSVIADPEFTELDQAFVQYKKDKLTLKLGRQVIALDGHRFVGHVGWRQDRQTFDAATVVYAVNDKMKVQYSYINQRNRIFGEAADRDSKDHLVNLNYKTSYGAFTAYSYLLEVDSDIDNALDTYGVSFRGGMKAAKKGDTTFLYSFEYATQSSENSLTGTSFDADYLFAEVGVKLPKITAKLGYEVLGSDNGNFGFATPLATLHKFNGWSDQFLGTPSQGLVDVIFTLSGNVAGGKWLAAYHDFSADESNASIDDLGSEINLQYVKPFAKHYTAAIKYAKYSGEGGRVDADKIWFWLTTKF